jgi:hypothetical protein
MISLGLAKALKYRVIILRTRGFSSLTINITYSSVSELTYFVSFEIRVFGI